MGGQRRGVRQRVSLVPAILAAILPMAAAPALIARPASAAETGAASQITACMAHARQTQGDPRACIGTVSKPCLDRAEDPSTAGMVECIDREHAVWDGLLNAAYQTLMKRLEPGKAQKLKASQRSWLAARELTCGFYQDYYEGTMAVPMIADCVSGETALRFFFLDGFVYDLTDAHVTPR